MGPLNDVLYRKKTGAGCPRKSALRKTGLKSLKANALTPRDENLLPGIWARANLLQCT